MDLATICTPSQLAFPKTSEKVGSTIRYTQSTEMVRRADKIREKYREAARRRYYTAGFVAR